MSGALPFSNSEDTEDSDDDILRSSLEKAFGIPFDVHHGASRADAVADRFHGLGDFRGEDDDGEEDEEAFLSRLQIRLDSETPSGNLLPPFESHVPGSLPEGGEPHPHRVAYEMDSFDSLDDRGMENGEGLWNDEAALTMELIENHFNSYPNRSKMRARSRPDDPTHDVAMPPRDLLPISPGDLQPSPTPTFEELSSFDRFGKGESLKNLMEALHSAYDLPLTGNIAELNKMIKRNAETRLSLGVVLEEIQRRLAVNKQLSRRLKVLAAFESFSKRKITHSLKSLQTTHAASLVLDKPGQNTPDLETQDAAIFKFLRSKTPVLSQVYPWTEKEDEQLLAGVNEQILGMLALEALDQNSGDDSKSAAMINQYSNEKQLSAIDYSNALPKIDWRQICDVHLNRRNETECRLRWINVVNPTINRSSWTFEEEMKLKEVSENRKLSDWEKISEDMNTNRRPIDYFQKYQRSLNPLILRREWSAEEDKKLIELVNLHGTRNWTSVSSSLTGRTSAQCFLRWDKVLMPRLQSKEKRTRRIWSFEENQRLYFAVEAYGSKNWKSISQILPGRTDVQCRERYCNIISRELDFSPWTEVEDKKLCEFVSIYGAHKWSTVANLMKPRTDNQCLRRWKWLNPDKAQTHRLANQIRRTHMPTNFVGRTQHRPKFEPLDLITRTDSENKDFISSITCGVSRNTKKSKPRKSARGSHPLKKMADNPSSSHFSGGNENENETSVIGMSNDKETERVISDNHTDSQGNLMNLKIENQAETFSGPRRIKDLMRRRKIDTTLQDNCGKKNADSPAKGRQRRKGKRTRNEDQTEPEKTSNEGIEKTKRRRKKVQETDAINGDKKTRKRRKKSNDVTLLPVPSQMENANGHEGKSNYNNDANEHQDEQSKITEPSSDLFEQDVYPEEFTREPKKSKKLAVENAGKSDEFGSTFVIDTEKEVQKLENGNDSGRKSIYSHADPNGDSMELEIVNEGESSLNQIKYQRKDITVADEEAEADEENVGEWEYEDIVEEENVNDSIKEDISGLKNNTNLEGNYQGEHKMKDKDNITIQDDQNREGNCDDKYDKQTEEEDQTNDFSKDAKHREEDEKEEEGKDEKKDKNRDEKKEEDKDEKKDEDRDEKREDDKDEKKDEGGDEKREDDKDEKKDEGGDENKEERDEKKEDKDEKEENGNEKKDEAGEKMKDKDVEKNGGDEKENKDKGTEKVGARDEKIDEDKNVRKNKGEKDDEKFGEEIEDKDEDKDAENHGAGDKKIDEGKDSKNDEGNEMKDRKENVEKDEENDGEKGKEKDVDKCITGGEKNDVKGDEEDGERNNGRSSENFDVMNVVRSDVMDCKTSETKRKEVNNVSSGGTSEEKEKITLENDEINKIGWKCEKRDEEKREVLLEKHEAVEKNEAVIDIFVGKKYSEKDEDKQDDANQREKINGNKMIIKDGDNNKYPEESEYEMKDNGSTEIQEKMQNLNLIQGVQKLESEYVDRILNESRNGMNVGDEIFKGKGITLEDEKRMVESSLYNEEKENVMKVQESETSRYKKSDDVINTQSKFERTVVDGNVTVSTCAETLNDEFQDECNIVNQNHDDVQNKIQQIGDEHIHNEYKDNHTNKMDSIDQRSFNNSYNVCTTENDKENNKDSKDGSGNDDRKNEGNEGEEHDENPNSNFNNLRNNTGTIESNDEVNGQGNGDRITKANIYIIGNENDNESSKLNGKNYRGKTSLKELANEEKEIQRIKRLERRRERERELRRRKKLVRVALREEKQDKNKKIMRKKRIREEEYEKDESENQEASEKKRVIEPDGKRKEGKLKVGMYERMMSFGKRGSKNTEFKKEITQKDLEGKQLEMIERKVMEENNEGVSKESEVQRIKRLEKRRAWSKEYRKKRMLELEKKKQDEEERNRADKSLTLHLINLMKDEINDETIKEKGFIVELLEYGHGVSEEDGKNEKKNEEEWEIRVNRKEKKIEKKIKQKGILELHGRKEMKENDKRKVVRRRKRGDEIEANAMGRKKTKVETIDEGRKSEEVLPNLKIDEIETVIGGKRALNTLDKTGLIRSILLESRSDIEAKSKSKKTDHDVLQEGNDCGEKKSANEKKKTVVDDKRNGNGTGKKRKTSEIVNIEEEPNAESEGEDRVILEIMGSLDRNKKIKDEKGKGTAKDGSVDADVDINQLTKVDFDEGIKRENFLEYRRNLEQEYRLSKKLEADRKWDEDEMRQRALEERKRLEELYANREIKRKNKAESHLSSPSVPSASNTLGFAQSSDLMVSHLHTDNFKFKTVPYSMHKNDALVLKADTLKDEGTQNSLGVNIHPIVDDSERNMFPIDSSKMKPNQRRQSKSSKIKEILEEEKSVELIDSESSDAEHHYHSENETGAKEKMRSTRREVDVKFEMHETTNTSGIKHNQKMNLDNHINYDKRLDRNRNDGELLDSKKRSKKAAVDDHSNKNTRPTSNSNWRKIESRFKHGGKKFEVAKKSLHDKNYGDMPVIDALSAYISSELYEKKGEKKKMESVKSEEVEIRPKTNLSVSTKRYDAGSEETADSETPASSDSDSTDDVKTQGAKVARVPSRHGPQPSGNKPPRIGQLLEVGKGKVKVKEHQPSVSEVKNEPEESLSSSRKSNRVRKFPSHLNMIFY